MEVHKRMRSTEKKRVAKCEEILTVENICNMLWI